jgi:putative transposase
MARKLDMMSRASERGGLEGEDKDVRVRKANPVGQGEKGLLKQLQKGLVEAALGSELIEHLGYDKNHTGSKTTANRPNGNSKKSLRIDNGSIDIDFPRDRDASFEPKIVGTHQREIPGFSDKILSMYSRGMTNREITEHLKEIYGTEVSPQFITSVTDGVS